MGHLSRSGVRFRAMSSFRAIIALVALLPGCEMLSTV